MRTVLQKIWQGLRDALAFDSPSERQYAETLRSRPQLADAEFYETFYGNTGIPRAIPARLRKLLTSIIGDNLAALQPQDNIAAIYDDLDFADGLYRVEREFDLRIPRTVVHFSSPSETPRSCPVDQIDGTFDSVVRYLVSSGLGRETGR